MARMLGWLSAATARASCSKRRNRSASEAKESGNSFRATSRPRRASRARYTSPMPPAPMSATISYGPNLVPGARAISAPHYSPSRVALWRVASGADGMQLPLIPKDGMSGAPSLWRPIGRLPGGQFHLVHPDMDGILVLVAVELDRDIHLGRVHAAGRVGAVYVVGIAVHRD